MSGGRLVGIDHVQLTMPEGAKHLAAARQFYQGALGLREVAKPEVLRPRGGIWFQGEGFQVHLGIEPPIDTRRHPGFATDDLDTVHQRCLAAGAEVTEDDGWPGVERFYVTDPFGNRIEVMRRLEAPPGT